MDHIRMTRADFASLAATTERPSIIVKDYGSPDDSTTGEESETDTPMRFLHQSWRLSQMSSTAYSIMKAVRYMKEGNQFACLTALSSIIDIDFTDETNASAVIQDDGLELMVNMLEVNNLKCRKGALKVMKHLTLNEKIVSMVVPLGIAPILVIRLIDEEMEEVALACDVIANVARKRRAARAVRKKGGIPILVSFLDVKKELLVASEESLDEKEKQILDLAISAGHALWKLARYTRVKNELVKTGLIPIMSNIILVGKKPLFIPLVGVLCECTSLMWFQIAIATDGLVGMLLLDTEEDDPLVQRLCCLTLMQAAHGNEDVRHLMRHHKGLRKLVRLLASVDTKDKPLLAAILGAIWKNAIAVENARVLDELGAIRLIMRHLEEFNLSVVEAAAGALAEIGKRSAGREEMVRQGVVMTLTSLMNRMHPRLLPNVVHALRECARDARGIMDIEAYDVVRSLWSLLNHQSTEVRIQAILALEPCVRYVKDSGELIRTITGSLLLLLDLLKGNDVEFLQAACALVAEVARDEENLAVMTEQGLAALLSALILRDNFEEPEASEKQEETRPSESESTMIRFDMPPHESSHSPTRVSRQGTPPKRTKPPKTVDLGGLQRQVTAAIANCCTRADNRQRFGSLGVIPKLVQLVQSKDALLQAQACRALHALSFSAANCVAMHSYDAVPVLLGAIASSNEMTQLGAAGCMYNLRNLLLRAERTRRRKNTGRFNMAFPATKASPSGTLQ